MKILYLSILPILNDNIGVVKKIKAQAESIKDNGVLIDVFILYKNESNLLDKKHFEDYFTFVRYPYSGVKRLFQLFNLWKIISEISSNKEYDVIYFRNPGSSFFFFKYLKKFKGKVVIEHNSIELNEIRLKSSRPNLNVWKEVFFAKKGYKYALGNVGKSTEFSMHQQTKVGYKLNIKTITNGIGVQDVCLRSNKPLKRKTDVNLIFVGNIAVWHGLERLLIGIKNCKGSSDYSLFLVGSEQAFLNMVHKLELTELLNRKIFLTGFITGKELDDLFNEADYAIGSLGLHRIDIFNGVPLKHREYLLRGLPFIYSGKDEDIDNSLSEYLFNIEPNESPVDFSKLLDFVQNLKKRDKNVSRILSDYAARNIDVSIKSKELIDFFAYSLNNGK